MIETFLSNFNLNVTKKEVETFKLYLDILQEWNSKINITSIKSYDDIIIKHLIDSLAVIKYIDINGKIVDVGSGGGFPGIPLKIMIPSLQVTLIEAKRKKANFLRFAIRESGYLQSSSCICETGAPLIISL